ncbi:MAG: alpha/beta hydrolase [Gammaproteobacteria bacterium]|jgi:alpha-beta hydrolase superfamily lysophospholipase|nr:alpha/beta hydrolase [Gammaproteobacteria bacterium]MBT3870604.1 alpha/beta hydrolase [Gammaproteobacteria bacterium]MBT4378189.1 alpha/beta hydrolase [Gammaproteobacteria bacterium]MBT4618727.1 alpha/beta hydrolase [Gammaproteobacteria bacterium]MBT5197070.1 alpha/beta hydrolase [Gammaproteobacteria bacterium]
MDSFSLSASDGHEVACYSWVLDNPKAVVQIAHGMGEHARRYDWVAQQLNANGYAVYANDHRGHGETSGPVLGYMGADGWNRSLADMYELGQLARGKHEGLKLILLGHSMGSMLSQQFITRYGCSIDALVLSGSPGFKESKLAFINLLLMKFERWRHGPDGTSMLMQNAIFGNSNAPFDGPGATGYEWLSRDQEEVATYIADDQCGFVLSPASLIDMSQGSAISQDKLSLLRIPQNLPIYIFSGAEDPVHGKQVDLDRLVNTYRKRGLSQLSYKLYPGGRHEMFNETNKDEVVTELVQWLEQQL